MAYPTFASYLGFYSGQLLPLIQYWTWSRCAAHQKVEILVESFCICSRNFFTQWVALTQVDC